MAGCSVQTAELILTNLAPKTEGPQDLFLTQVILKSFELLFVARGHPASRANSVSVCSLAGANSFRKLVNFALRSQISV